ncbi:MAG TPA: LysR family transcriptional regulator [Xanthomonadaceae bacterium]|nr:LysR family transcriptional regulator [Xanthomonadaceae bacterium]
MDIRQLRTLVEVVRRGGFSAAAQSLFATQPTISKAIRQLEDELELVLIDRSRQGVRLTQAGEIVYRRALVLLGERDNLLAELEELRGLKRGELNIGLPPLGSDVLFAPLFAIYRQRYPHIDLKVLEQGSQALEDSLRAGEVEIAGSLLPVSDDFQWQSVRKEPLTVLLPRAHPLAQHAALRLEMLAETPFILFDKGFMFNRRIVEACQRHGFTPQEVARSGQIDFIVALVAAGMGLAMLPRMIALRRPRPDVAVLPLLDDDLAWHMALVWRRGAFLSHAAQAWLQLAAEQDEAASGA